MLYVGDNKYRVYVGSQRLKPVVKPLPYDAEVEYLENTGSSYIDTGYICNNKTSVEVKFQYTNTKAQSYIFSSCTQWDAIFALYINGRSKIAYSSHNSKTYYNTQITPDTNIHIATLSACESAGTFTYDNKVFNNTAGTRRNEPVRLFASVDLYGPGLVRIFYIRFLEDGVPMRNYIPVRKNEIGYLYDKVENKLYGNLGNDAFVYGNDK